MLPTRLEGASTHNLQGISAAFAPGEIVVITGVSGAGKSSLAMDTLYAEGQRRFVESFSPYARQFLERLERPPIERLEPVPAAIAVDRKAPIKSSRSTVASMADLGPYLAALFTRESVPVCPTHGSEAVAFDVTDATQHVLSRLAGQRAVITYSVPALSTEHYLDVREALLSEGYRRIWVNGKTRDLDELKPSEALGATDRVRVVVDRTRATADNRSRLAASIEGAWQRGGGTAELFSDDSECRLVRGLACGECGLRLEPPRPGLFSYDSPLGACPLCRGFGRTLGIDLEKVVPDPGLSLKRGAVRPFRGKSTSWERGALTKLCKRHDIPMDAAWRDLTPLQQRLVIAGDGDWDNGFPGVLGWFRWMETRTYKMHVRVMLARYRSYDLCSECKGQRLNPTALSYRVSGKSLAAWHALEVREAKKLTSELKTRSGQGELSRRELESRLGYLDRVGLGYLTLDRQGRTLSGGEAQRVTLTAALGTSLHNALFVLDEPTVGLHPSDVAPLLRLVRELADRQNTVLVVEHDPQVIRFADRVLELGPGAGREGGRIVADGAPAEVRAAHGATARALRAKSTRARVTRAAEQWLTVRGASANNLRSIDVEIPLGCVTVLTGPSGSGKSSIAEDVVYRALARCFGKLDVEPPGAHQRLDGVEALRHVVLVDQSPLGRTSRGNPATYTKAWDTIRVLFAREPDAILAKLSASDFSFNVEGGRCEACAGEGAETVEMQFLADVRLECPVCRGKRFQDRVLSVRHRGLSIAEVLDHTIDQVLERFSGESAVQRLLGPLSRLGLGYLRLGQPLSTLSGGEAQRLKLARALSQEQKHTLFILDEPSAGLHADEVGRLLDALDAIVKGGGSVLVVEHDLEVIRAADHVVDMGPGAGASGGRVVAQGTPAEIERGQSRTGLALKARRLAPRGKPNGSKPSGENALSVIRAREHNLKDVCVAIPHGTLTVVTGPSGSGKSTLAFDVVFAEGQRRFLETLTPYARQFLPTMPRPDVDAVSGVPPSIALEQRTARAGAHSTVATVTEVAHYLRLLFAKLGVAHCPTHDRPIERTTLPALLRTLQRETGKQSLLAPAVRARKGTYLEVFNAASRHGIREAICDGKRVSTDAPPRLARSREHDIDLVIQERLEPKDLTLEVLEPALRLGNGMVKLVSARGVERLLSIQSSCPECGFSVPELDPRWFSFNTRQGRCEACEGSGLHSTPKPRRGRRGRRKQEAEGKLEVSQEPCPKCHGSRLSPIPGAVRLEGDRYPEFTRLSVLQTLSRVATWNFSGDAALVAHAPRVELERRLEFLRDVGLDYLALDRAASSLSGGEMQRLRLAAQLGAGLTGALYVLDEPTIGLHPRDTGRLLSNLKKLIDIGSTVLLVEHDVDTIRAADYLIDLGPAGGARGGHVIAAGSPKQVLATPGSPTAAALAHPAPLRKGLACGGQARLRLRGASEHNLKDVDLEVPLGRLTVVAGVSGSGKSTLITKVLLPCLRARLGLVGETPGAHRALSGFESLKRAVAVDQSPIGRTPRSVPATFLGIWNGVRALFSACPEARVEGFDAARFSFNTPSGGRCTTCSGQGVITHEMSFLPDVVSVCPTCNGQRFEPRTLAIRYQGLSVGDVLKLTAEEAAAFFENHPSIVQPLKTLCELGAGYITLGQGSHTLSGGEAQRLKLADELTASARHEATLYVLDEPTTGLHLSDVAKLMQVLGRLVERGDTLVIIEHHPVVIAGADYVVELGPDGGERGGRIVAAGTPREVARARTATGPVLKEELARGPAERRAPRAASVPTTLEHP